MGCVCCQKDLTGVLGVYGGVVFFFNKDRTAKKKRKVYLKFLFEQACNV